MSDLENKVLGNVKEMILPVLERLRKCRLDARQEAYVDVLETRLNEIVSPFLHSLLSKYSGITPAELMVANLVKEGKKSKKSQR